MSEAVSTGLLDRAIRRITEVWRDMASSVSGEPDETLEAQMQACLAGRGGEVSARNRAAKLAQTYLTQDEAGRKHFLRTLAGFDSDPDAVADAYSKVQAAADIGGTGHRQGRAATRAGTAAAEAADAVHLDPRRAEIPGRPARVAAEGARHGQAADGAGRRPARPARRLVRHRLPGTAAHRLEQPRRAAGKAGRLRGGACDPLLARPEEPAGFRPPLLRLLPSPHARRTADLRRGRAGEGPGRQRAGSAGRESPGAGSGARRHRDLLLDQQLPVGPGRHQLRQLPDQARGRGTVRRVPQPENLRHPVADPRLPPLAGPAAGEERTWPAQRRRSLQPGRRLPGRDRVARHSLASSPSGIGGATPRCASPPNRCWSASARAI